MLLGRGDGERWEVGEYAANDGSWLALQVPKCRDGVTVQPRAKIGTHSHEKEKRTKDGDRIVVHEAIGRVGIKVCREAERKEKGDPMQIS